jgi:hypothetical protein
MSSFSCLLFLLGETWFGLFFDNDGGGECAVEFVCPDLVGEDELVMFRDLEREKDWGMQFVGRNDDGDYEA